MPHLFLILMPRFSKIAYISLTKTWIGNRRRKYRLMGIEVPPPRGGPADFSEQPESGSLSALTPGEEAGPEVGEDNDRNDEVSICLSEASSQGTLVHLLITTALGNLMYFYLLFSVLHFKSRVFKTYDQAFVKKQIYFLMLLCKKSSISSHHKEHSSITIVMAYF